MVERERRRVVATFQAITGRGGDQDGYRLVRVDREGSTTWEVERQAQDALGGVSWVSYLTGIEASAPAHRTATVTRAFIAAMLEAVAG